MRGFKTSGNSTWNPESRFPRRQSDGRSRTPIITRRWRPSTLIIICVHLGCKPDEIREILTTYTDDKYFHKLIGKQPKEVLSTFDDALLKATTEIVKGNPSAPKLVADMLDFVAATSSVDVTIHTDKIRRSTQKAV